VVVVERHPERIRRLQALSIPVIDGDATSEATLRAARIDHAHGMVSCLNDDAHNVYTVLTARALNAHLFIVARATEEDAERRIRQAGADRIVNPYNLGGTRLAHLVSKPAIVGFYDVSSDTPDALQFDQVSLSGTSALVGKSLVELSLRQRWHLGVVAIQRGTEVHANPPSELTLAGGDVLAVFGTRQHIQAFEKACAST
jgi:voltage-gated potassium channel